ncbi:MAG: EF-hand domain-containing protein [Pseudoxanthomonas sp.]
MTVQNRKHCHPLALLIALAAAATAPMAFAQDATTAPPQDPAQTQPTPPPTSADPAATDPSSSTQTPEAASSAPKQGWEDVDTDKDGAISKQEAAVNPGLSQVFDQADANGDGKLTTDEYKDFVSKNYGDQPQTTP